MEKYKRITLYFKVDDPQDSLRYALIGSLGKGKKVIFDKMIDQYLQTYGIDNLEDLTLKDLQIIKKELMGIEVEQKEKRGRGRPKKIQEPKPVHPAEEIKEIPKNDEQYAEKGEIKEEKVETVVTQTEKEEQRIEVKEEKKEVKMEYIIQPIKQKNPMAVNIDDDEDDDDFNGGVEADLLGQIGAFF